MGGKRPFPLNLLLPQPACWGADTTRMATKVAVRAMAALCAALAHVLDVACSAQDLATKAALLRCVLLASCLMAVRRCPSALGADYVSGPKQPPNAFRGKDVVARALAAASGDEARSAAAAALAVHLDVSRLFSRVTRLVVACEAGRGHQSLDAVAAAAECITNGASPATQVSAAAELLFQPGRGAAASISVAAPQTAGGSAKRLRPDAQPAATEPAAAAATWPAAVEPAASASQRQTRSSSQALQPETSSDGALAPRVGLTPSWLIHAGCDILGLTPPCPAQPVVRGLLDPCTNSKERPNIPAERLYDCKDDGLAEENGWAGYSLILNPPYTKELQHRFVDRARDEVAVGRVHGVVLVCRNSTDTNWFQRLSAHPRCMLHRACIRFKDYPDAAPISFGICVFIIATARTLSGVASLLTPRPARVPGGPPPALLRRHGRTRRLVHPRGRLLRPLRRVRSAVQPSVCSRAAGGAHLAVRRVRLVVRERRRLPVRRLRQRVRGRMDHLHAITCSASSSPSAHLRHVPDTPAMKDTTISL